MKKLFVGLGAAATIVAPIASSVSFSIKPTTQQTDLKGFLTNFNNAPIIGTITDALKKKITADKFYTGNLRSLPITNSTSTSYWRIDSPEKLEAVFKELTALDSTKYTIDEKYTIAKNILEANAYTDLVENLGFNPDATVTESDIQATWGPETSLLDKTTQVSTVQGKTGYQSNYHQGKADQGNDRIYDISNQDILIYYESVAFLSTSFNDIYKVADNYVNGDTTADNNLVNLIANWNKAVDDFYKLITSPKIDVNWIQTLPDFKYIQKINGAPTNEDEAYNLILNSKIISKSYDAKTITEMQAHYATASDRSKIILQGSLIERINTTLQTYIQSAVDNFNKTEFQNSIFKEYLVEDVNNKKQLLKITKPTEILKGDELESGLSLAKALVSHSNHFALDIELRINDNPFTDYGLEIRGGHNKDTAFEKVNQLNIKIPFLKYNNDATLDFVYGYAKSPVQSSNSVNVLVDKTTSYRLPTITADQKAIMSSDYAIYYAMKLEIAGNRFEPRLIVYENDHDHDADLKNVDEHRYEGFLQDLYTVGQGLATGLDYVVIGVETAAGTTASIPSVAGVFKQANSNVLIWQPAPNGSKVVLTLADHNPSAYLDFWRQEKSTAPSEDETTRFTELEKELADLFGGEWNNWLTETKNSGKFDPSSTYIPTLTINTVTFPEVRFNTYDDSGWDDTHSDNFRFTNGMINYTFRVIEKVN